MNNSDNGRRRLLKALGAGSGVVVAQQSLPTEWAKPVVESVLLPAHAQTTTASTDEPSTDEPECNLPTIREASITCDTPNGIEFRYYAIRTANTPCGFTITESDTDPGFPYVRVFLQSGGTDSEILVESIDTGGGLFGTSELRVSCPGATPSGGVGNNFPMTAQDELGQSYTVNGTLQVVVGIGVTMSVLTVTPV